MSDLPPETPELLLRDILDLPFPSELQAAPRGDRVAWVTNERGCRNVWLAVAGGAGVARAVPLTRYVGDDGRVIGQLRWTRACDAVIYTRGTQLGDGIPANPDSAPEGVGGPEIWRVDISATSPRRIGFGHSPEVSPATGDIVWIHEGQIWSVDEEGRRVPSRLVADRGRCSQLSWSPDGDRLAFVSDRGEHALIGVHDRAERTVRWLSPSIDRDMAPTWTPDSERIAFIRLAESPVPTHLSRPAGVPWSLWVADARSGRAHRVWKAGAGRGSVFVAFSSGPALAWTASGAIAFPWEGTGWLHLHAITPGAPEPVDLTPGEFEVAAVAYDGRTDTAIIAANKDDITGCRLWRVGLADRTLVALTPPRKLMAAPMVTGDGCVVALQADARAPVQPVSIDAAGTVRTLAAAAFPAVLPELGLAEPQQVKFRAADEREIHAQLFLPPGVRKSSTPRPAIVHFHGGPTRQMFPAWHPTESYHLQYGLNQVLANRGYVVLSVNYRGGSGRGLEFREAERIGAGGASEFEDVVGAANFLRARADVDSRRIGAYGMSYGGFLTALALARASELFAAGVDISGIADWSAAFDPLQTDVWRSALESSPVAAAEKWRSPVLFVHADDDRVVPFDQTVELIRTLRRRSPAEVESLVLPDEQHDFVRHESWRRALAAAADFFDRKLGCAAG